MDIAAETNFKVNVAKIQKKSEIQIFFSFFYDFFATIVN